MGSRYRPQQLSEEAYLNAPRVAYQPVADKTSELGNTIKEGGQRIAEIQAANSRQNTLDQRESNDKFWNRLSEIPKDLQKQRIASEESQARQMQMEKASEDLTAARHTNAMNAQFDSKERLAALDGILNSNRSDAEKFQAFHARNELLKKIDPGSGKSYNELEISAPLEAQQAGTAATRQSTQQSADLAPVVKRQAEASAASTEANTQTTNALRPGEVEARGISNTGGKIANTSAQRAEDVKRTISLISTVEPAIPDSVRQQFSGNPEGLQNWVNVARQNNVHDLLPQIKDMDPTIVGEAMEQSGVNAMTKKALMNNIYATDQKEGPIRQAQGEAAAHAIKEHNDLQTLKSQLSSSLSQYKKGDYKDPIAEANLRSFAQTVAAKDPQLAEKLNSLLSFQFSLTPVKVREKLAQDIMNDFLEHTKATYQDLAKRAPSLQSISDKMEQGDYDLPSGSIVPVSKNKNGFVNTPPAAAGPAPKAIPAGNPGPAHPNRNGSSFQYVQPVAGPQQPSL